MITIDHRLACEAVLTRRRHTPAGPPTPVRTRHKLVEVFLESGVPTVTFVEPELFYPRTPEQIENAYAVHHKARAWKDEEGLRAMLTKAEARLLKSQEETLKWRRRAEEAEAELERFRPAARS